MKILNLVLLKRILSFIWSQYIKKQMLDHIQCLRSILKIQNYKDNEGIFINNLFRFNSRIKLYWIAIINLMWRFSLTRVCKLAIFNSMWRFSLTRICRFAILNMRLFCDSWRDEIMKFYSIFKLWIMKS